MLSTSVQGFHTTFVEHSHYVTYQNFCVLNCEPLRQHPTLYVLNSNPGNRCSLHAFT